MDSQNPDEEQSQLSEEMKGGLGENEFVCLQLLKMMPVDWILFLLKERA